MEYAYTNARTIVHTTADDIPCNTLATHITAYVRASMSMTCEPASSRRPMMRGILRVLYHSEKTAMGGVTIRRNQSESLIKDMNTYKGQGQLTGKQNHIYATCG